MKRILIGEDIAPTPIGEEEDFYADDDYRVISSEGAFKAQAGQPVPAAAPAWEPFVFPERAGYSLEGYVLWENDIEDGIPAKRISALPEGAVKSSVPNVWHWKTKWVSAEPIYKIIPVQATGECIGCSRIQCARRSKGLKCRNFRP